MGRVLGVAGLLACAVSCTRRTTDDRACALGEHVVASDRCNICECIGGRWEAADRECWTGLAPAQGIACFDGGVRDFDPARPGVQVECNVIRTVPDASGGLFEHVSACVREGDGYTWADADTEVCYVVRTDVTGQGDPLDDVSAACIEHRGELVAIEFELLYRPGVWTAQTSIAVSCAPPEPYCPGWPVEGA